MELTKQQKVLLFENILKQYIKESELNRNELLKYRIKNDLYPGMCGRVSKESKILFGESIFAIDILEFRATCRKLDITPHDYRLFYHWADIESRIEFLDICISIC